MFLVAVSHVIVERCESLFLVHRCLFAMRKQRHYDAMLSCRRLSLKETIKGEQDNKTKMLINNVWRAETLEYSIVHHDNKEYTLLNVLKMHSSSSYPITILA